MTTRIPFKGTTHVLTAAERKEARAYLARVTEDVADIRTYVARNVGTDNAEVREAYLDALGALTAVIELLGVEC